MGEFNVKFTGGTIVTSFSRHMVSNQ